MGHGEAQEPLSSGFRWLLVGRAIDATGNNVQPLALGFAMLEIFGSATALGVMVGATLLGQVSLLLIGGVAADRLPRSVVLVWSNIVAAAAQVAIVAIAVARWDALPLLAVLGFISGAASAFDHPATVALVPHLVRPSQLQRANGYLGSVRRAAGIGAAPIAGILIATIGPAWTLSLDAASFLLAAFCFSRIPEVPFTPSGLTPKQDLVDGWREFVRHRWVVVVVAAFFLLVAAWVGGFHVLGIVIADQTVGPEGWGVVLGAFGLGGVAVGLLASRAPEARRPLVWGMVGVAVSTAPLFALALQPTLAVLVPAGFVGGATFTYFGIAWETALQRHIAPEKLARVASIDMLGSMAAAPIGTVVAGPLADSVGAGTAVLWSAIFIVVVSLLTLASRAVRELRSGAESPTEPASVAQV